MKVSVIGLGYMGLPMAAVLAKSGHDVVGVDISPRVVERVNAGVCPFEEKDMPELVKVAHESGRLRAVLAPEAGCEVYILSLPTPVDHATHEPDMAFVEAGARSIAPVLVGGELVVLESTSPVGATQRNVKDVIEALRPDLVGKVDYVFCPERAIPGNTLYEMVANDRLVGGLTPRAQERAMALYKSFCTGELLPCKPEEAEMVKMVENASRDAQIAFANELSMVCHKLGLDVWRVIELANHHPRVNILTPGAGVGGHCIAVDPWFIINSAPAETPLMRVVRQVNDAKPFWVVSQILRAALAVGKQRPVVACLGLAYKPNVDDLRESPSITIVKELAKGDVELRIVEPYLENWELPLVSLEQALADADIVVSLTAHNAFKELTSAQFGNKLVVDACGMWRGKVEDGKLVA